MKIDIPNLGSYHIALGVMVDGVDTDIDTITHDNAQQVVNAIKNSNKVKLTWVRTNEPILLSSVLYDKLMIDIIKFPPNRRPPLLKKGVNHKVCWRARNAGRPSLKSTLTKTAQDELDTTYFEFMTDIYDTAIEQLRENALQQAHKNITKLVHVYQTRTDKLHAVLGHL